MVGVFFCLINKRNETNYCCLKVKLFIDSIGNTAKNELLRISVIYICNISTYLFLNQKTSLNLLLQN